MMRYLVLAFLFLGVLVTSCEREKEPKISIAEWSLHRTIRSGELTNLEFPAFVKQKFGINAIEFVNQFFFDKAQDLLYLKRLKYKCDSSGVRALLIMVDGEGHLGEANDSLRKVAVENHKKWVRAAQFLGCHSIRVNAGGTGAKDEVQTAAIQSLQSLSDYAKHYNINIIVENHGGYSSDGEWLSSVIQTVNKPNCGTLPDFGNFYEYDRYKGVNEMMPFAKGVSAKTNGFKPNGEDTIVDFKRMLEIVKKHDYAGYIGIEYEGSNENEVEGIKRSIALVKKYY